jgi:hypothetical protein
VSVAGAVSLTNSGTVELRLGGTGSGQYDNIAAGQVTLAGTLDVKLINAFVPSTGDQFGVLSYSSVNGAFGTINGNGHTYVPTYGASLLTIQKQ